VRFRETAEGDAWEEVSWKSVLVRVTTMVKEADPRSARDITGIEAVPLPEPGRGWLLPLALGAAGLAALLGGWFAVRRRAGRIPAMEPDVWALGELARVEALADAVAAERYHTLLSDVIRRYIEMRFGLRAPRQTTAEFLEAARQASPLTPSDQQMLRDFLERCDLAKFAQARPSPQACREVTALARAFIEQTRGAVTAPV
jgi:hypothetical protein